MTTRPQDQRGVTLISVMVAAAVFAFGLLALATTHARLTTTTTQNQNLLQIAGFSNAYWGLVQANTGVISSMDGTYTSANVTAAPAPLQRWLTEVTAALPDASVVIATGPDAAAGGACTSSGGCSSSLTIQWTQNGNPNSNATAGLTRTQTFNFQFGL